MWLSVPVSGVSPECRCYWRQCLVYGCLHDLLCHVCVYVSAHTCVYVCVYIHQAGLQQPGRRGPGMEQLEKVAALNIP